jgi:hypothetical protein
MTYLTTTGDVIADSETAAAAAFSRSGTVIDPGVLDEVLTEIADKAAGTWREYLDAFRLGRESELPYPTAAVTHLLAVTAALRAALRYTPTDTATEVTAAVRRAETHTAAGDQVRLHLVAQHGALIALGASDRLAGNIHERMHNEASPNPPDYREHRIDLHLWTEADVERRIAAGVADGYARQQFDKLYREHLSRATDTDDRGGGS